MKVFIFYFFILSIIPFTVNAQSKKKQIARLKYELDSLNTVFVDLKNKSELSISNLDSDLKKSLSTNKSLNLELELCVNERKTAFHKFNAEINNLKNDKNKLLSEVDSIKMLLENEKFKRLKYAFDTIEYGKIFTCYHYYSKFPHLISSPHSDDLRLKINELIKNMSFKVPAVMQNANYKEYRKCEEGDYVKSKDDCDWCVSRFNSGIKYFEAKKYLSILMEVYFEAGGNWGNYGFNSLILRNNSVITIPSNQNVKNQLISEIKNHLVKNPLLITDPMSNQKTEYPILKEIEQWNVDDLTFYFKNDELRLIFNSGEHGNGNMNFDIALPQLQKFLNL